MLNLPAFACQSNVPENNTGYTCVGTVHVESTCYTCWIYLHSRVNRGPRKQHGVHMCWYCACWINLLYMLNLPAFACQSNVPKTTRAHVCYSCSVLKWHMRSQTRMLEQHRHWATRVHSVLNSGTFDWHAIACSFSTFFFGVTPGSRHEGRRGPWGRGRSPDIWGTGPVSPAAPTSLREYCGREGPHNTVPGASWWRSNVY